MSTNRYIVEFFAENSDVLDTFFVEADTKESAKEKTADQYGAFINIVACNLTKTSGGPGATFQPEVLVVTPEPVIEVVPEETVTVTDVNGVVEPVSVPTVKPVVKETKEKPVKVKKEKVLKEVKEKPVKVPKVTNASRIREQVLIAKANGTDPKVVIAWAMENCGQAKGMASGYVKCIWKETE